MKLTNFTFTYADHESPTLKHLNLQFSAGELALICGPTGSGKSTLLQVFNGLVPHYSAGIASGKLEIAGVDFTGKLPNEFSEHVGYVNQHAELSFVTDTVCDELAFGMEQLGVAPQEMQQKIESVAKLLGIANLLDANLTELSGGQQQKVAIGAALAAGQKILLLDEPTSELDSESAHELLLELKGLCVDHQLTILLAEHRIERAIGLVDSVTVVHQDGSASKATAPDLAPILKDYRMVPPIVELGQLLKLNPLPLTITDFKNQRFQFADVAADDLETDVLLSIENLSVEYDGRLAVKNANLKVIKNWVIGLMGPNGSGKSSLLWQIQRQHPEQVALLPQTSSDLLMFSTIAEELSDSDRESGKTPGHTASIFTKLGARQNPQGHPRDLSAGGQLSLALAISLSQPKPIILLDEPTRGLDYEAKRMLAKQLEALKREKAILLASHDVEFLAMVADSIIEISDGEVSEARSPFESLTKLGDLAPQIWQATGTALNVEQALVTVNR